MTLRTLNYGNYGIFLIMGNAGFCPSAVVMIVRPETTQAPILNTSKSPDRALRFQEPYVKEAYSNYQGRYVKARPFLGPSVLISNEALQP